MEGKKAEELFAVLSRGYVTARRSPSLAPLSHDFVVPALLIEGDLRKVGTSDFSETAAQKGRPSDMQSDARRSRAIVARGGRATQGDVHERSDPSTRPPASEASLGRRAPVRASTSKSPEPPPHRSVPHATALPSADAEQPKLLAHICLREPRKPSAPASWQTGGGGRVWVSKGRGREPAQTGFRVLPDTAREAPRAF